MTTLTHDSKNEEEIYFNFINSIKSEVTKETYEKNIKSFNEVLQCNQIIRSSVNRYTETNSKIFDVIKRKRFIVQYTFADSMCNLPLLRNE
jgi:hypothetical protein